MSNGGYSASLDRLSQDQLRSAKATTTLDYITGTAVLEFRPAETLSRVGAISPTYPVSADRATSHGRTPARKAGVLDRSALLPLRDRLSAGGRWMRTCSTAARKPKILERPRH